MIFPVRCYVVQHILQPVELVIVKHTDRADGYPLCGNPATGPPAMGKEGGGAP